MSGSKYRSFLVDPLCAAVICGLMLANSSFSQQRPDWPRTALGSESAPVTILVFSDFESFPCSRSAQVLTGLVRGAKDVRLIFKYSPAASNLHAIEAHEAALAAGAENKFWEMHDLLFANQQNLTRTDLIRYATHLSVNIRLFEHALDNHTYRP